MRKWKQALALVLALVMALSLVALPSFAADEDSTGTGTAVTEGSTNTPGLELRKVYDPSRGLLTLEAYATGSTTTTTTKNPWTSSWSWTSPARWTLPYPTTITIILETTTTRLCMI